LALAQEITDAIGRLPGFGSYRGGGDRASGAVVGVSTWDTDAHARFNPAALGDLMDRLAATGVRLEPPEIYEVVAER
jgi:hypothetical protein